MLKANIVIYHIDFDCCSMPRKNLNTHIFKCICTVNDFNLMDRRFCPEMQLANALKVYWIWNQILISTCRSQGGLQKLSGRANPNTETEVANN